MTELQFGRESYRREVLAYHGFNGCQCVDSRCYFSRLFVSKLELFALQLRCSDALHVFYLAGALAGGRIDRGDAKLQEAIFEETFLDVSFQRVRQLR